jgi:cell division protein FtsL
MRRPLNPPVAGRARIPEIFFVKNVDNSRLVREVDPARRRECFSLLGLCIVFFLSVLVLSWQHLQCVRAGYEIQQLKAQRAALEECEHQLTLEQAALADPHRIDTLARKDLGMISPNPKQVIQWGEAAPSSPQQPESTEFARNFSAVGENSPGEP